MHDIVERTCEVLVGDGGVLVVYNQKIGAQEAFANLHPIACGKPAYDYIEYGSHKVYMCLEHFTACDSPLGPLDIAGLGWKYVEDKDGDSDS